MRDQFFYSSDVSRITDFFNSGPINNGFWWEPSISPNLIYKVLERSSTHQSCLQLKINCLALSFEETPFLKMESFNSFAYDFFAFGNAYLKLNRNRLGGVISVEHLQTMRCRISNNGLYLLDSNTFSQSRLFVDNAHYARIHEYDPRTKIYGKPYYWSALNAINLNNQATLFRHKYYTNGGHVGLLIYSTVDKLGAETKAEIKKKVEALSNGGAFQTMFLHTPTEKGGFEVKPIGEIGAKDEFASIKNISRSDILMAHRIAPELLGVIPENVGGLGNPETAERVFNKLELEPIKRKMEALNKTIGADVFKFTKPTPED